MKIKKTVLSALVSAVMFGAFAADTRVTVNGTDVSAGAGEGWTFADKVLTLSDPGLYVLSGTNELGEVHVSQEASATVVLSNLWLYTSEAGYPVYSVGRGETEEDSTDAVRADIRLYGSNRLVNTTGSDGDRLRQGGISVYRGSTVQIDKADGFANEDVFLQVTGGAGSAGIGGCRNWSTGRIIISGGTIRAYGGSDAADIGGGNYAGTDGEVAGWVKIEGGVVKPGGRLSPRGIGAGREIKFGEGYDICIQGGTVEVSRGDIASSSTDDGQPVRITGGNVNGPVVNPQDGDGNQLWCVTVSELGEAPVAVDGLPDGYGTKDIVPIDGNVYLWLPNGTYDFTVDGKFYTAQVDGDNTVARRRQLLGVTVNGTDIIEGSGAGWTFADKVLTLSGADSYVLSGSNTTSEVFVRQVADSTVVFSNLVLSAFSEDGAMPTYRIGAGEGNEGAVSARILLAGTNEIVCTSSIDSDDSCNAAIFVARGSTVLFDAAEGLANEEAILTAQGGMYAAAIGGSSGHPTGTIIIDGGTIVARSTAGAAGIGGGRYRWRSGDGLYAGYVQITGGHVLAFGAGESAGIGYGSTYGENGRGYNVQITGGTVEAFGGTNESGQPIAPDIASSSKASYVTLIMGGNVQGSVQNSERKLSNPGKFLYEPVWCVTVPDIGKGPVAVEGLPLEYGTNDIVSTDGNVYLWLPDGEYLFRANDRPFKVKVEGAAALAVSWLSGVSVNGRDVAFGSGAGWHYADHTLVLSEAGSFVLSGTNTTGDVFVRQAEVSTVVLSNLVLTANDHDGLYPPYMVGASETNGSHMAHIRLAGENRLVNLSSTLYYRYRNAAICVNAGWTLVLDAAEGLANEQACLTAVGGRGGAGIGGSCDHSTGTIVVNGGTICATGGEDAAGIGGGRYLGTLRETAGVVEIRGGIVLAQGGAKGAGIGCYNDLATGEGYAVSVMGGTVVATPGNGAEFGLAAMPRDIGTNRVVITGGSVKGVAYKPVCATNAAVFCVTVPGVGTGPIKLEGLRDYGTTDLRPVDGCLFLWLPDGEYTFKVDGVRYCAFVNGGATTAVVCTGFTVNGVDLALGMGRGWSFDGTCLTIDGSAVPSVAFAGEVPQSLAVTVGGLAEEAVLAVSVTGSVLGVSAEATFTLSPKAGARTFDESDFVVRSNGTLRLGNGVYYFDPEGRFDAERQVAVIVGDEVWVVIDRPQETGITVNALDIGGVEWTSEGSVCHFDTNTWTLAFNDGLHFSLAGTNLTDRAVRMSLAPTGLSVSFTNLVITAETGASFALAPGGDDRCWGAFTNAAGEVRLGEGFYAFDPSERILDGLSSLPYGNGRWRVVPAGTFKAMATVGERDFGCCSLAEALALAGCGGRIELLADIVDEPLAVGDGASFELFGNGHRVAPILGTEPIFTVSSNATIRIFDVTFDGRGGAAAGFAAVKPSGSLVLNGVTVRNMKFERGAPLIRDDEGALTVSGLTASNLSVTNFSGSASLIAVANRSGHAENVRLLSATLTDVDVAYENLLSVEAGGVEVSGDFSKGTIVLRAGEPTWIEAAPPTAGYVLSIVAPDRRVGSVIVKGGGVSAADVRVCQAGYAAFASGDDIVLDTVWSHSFAVMTVDGAVTNFTTHASFEAAIAAAGTNAEIRLVDYVNDAIGLTTNVVVGSATVPAGSAVTLGTALRHSTDGTNTIWSARSETPATLAGDLTVAGTLRLGDIVPGGAVTVTGAGVIGIAESFSLTNTMLYVTIADPVARAGSVVITSDFWTPAQLKAHCRVTNAGWTFAPSEGEGLLLTTVGYAVARVGEVDFPCVEAAATAVATGGVVSLVSYTNVTTGLSFDEVTTTGRVLAVDRSFTLASCLKISDGLNYEWDFAPAVPTVFNLDGVTLKLGSQTVLTLGNVRIAGTLTLAGEGLLDVTEYAGMAPIAIRLAPGAQGVSGRRIAKGEARQFALAGGEGRLVTVDGYVCWESDTITCSYEQVANGVVSVKIFKGPTCVKTDPSVEVHRGRATYRYHDPEPKPDGRDYEFTLKAVFVDWQNVRRFYAPNGSEYMTTRGVYKAFEGTPEDGIAMPNDIRLQRDGGLHVRCRFLKDASAEPALSCVSNDEHEYVSPEVVSEKELDAYLDRNPEAEDDLDNPNPDVHGSDIVSAHIALETSLLAMSGGRLAKGVLSYRLFKKAFTVFGAVVTLEDLIRSIVSMVKKAIDFHDNPLVYGESYGRGRFKELCERCAKDNGAGDSGKTVYLRHAIDLDALKLATGGIGFVRFNGEFTTPGEEVFKAFLDYSEKLDLALDVLGWVTTFIDVAISISEKSAEKLSVISWILTAAEKAGALIENCLLLIYRYEFFNPPIDGSILIDTGVKYDIQNVKFDANRNTRYTRALKPALQNVRTAPLLVAYEGSTLEFSSAELKNYTYSSPSGLVYVCSGATLVLKDFSVSGNTYSGTGAIVPPIVAAPGATIWVCGGTSVQGIASAGADLRVGYGPHGTDDPKSAGLSGQIVIAGETPYGAKIGSVSFPDVTTSAAGRIFSGKYGAWLTPTIDGDLVWTVRKEKVAELTPIAFDPVEPFAIGVLGAQTNRTAVLSGKLVCPTAAARAALPLEFRILQTGSLTQPFGAAEVISVGADGRFLKEVDGLKSSPSRFFRLDYEWKESPRP